MRKQGAVKPLETALLCQRCDAGEFKFETTAELEDLTEIIGQARAVDAVRFGIGIRSEGFNLFALGPSGTGKRSVVRQFIQQKAALEQTPSDWCYVNNFDVPHKPLALRLPPGHGGVLRKDMAQLVEELISVIPAVFDSDDYRTRKQVIQAEFKERQEKAFGELQARAEAKAVALIRTPVGFAFAPMRDDKVLEPEEFDKLPDDERKRVEEEVTQFQEQLRAILHQVPQWEKESRGKLKELNREVTMLAVGHLIDALRVKHAAVPELIGYLDAVQQDVIDNPHDFLNPTEAAAESASAGFPPSRSVAGSPAFRRYQVNVLIDNSATQGAPVIYEDNPTYQNLVGRIEHISQMGVLVTDFNLIKAGALHRACGGYLMLDAYKVLLQPFAWEGLKRVLRSSEIVIESLGQILSLVSTVSLEPTPIPLSIKVVLLGERMLYYLLSSLDPEFNELFKVAADFDEHMPRTPENNLLYAKLIGSLARKEGLRHFERNAVARVIDQSSRMLGDAKKLSTCMGGVADLLREADYWAGETGGNIVSAADVQRAIDARIYRDDRLRERIVEEIGRGTLLIDTHGAKVGQINGLSVIDLGHYMFGHPTRITARVWMGKGEVVDIERKVELGGPIHSKGVLILTAFLGERYASQQPLSLSASLVFEQTYGGVEGDSASCAELYALLSALAQLPIDQSLAVTGSVNQHGQVQAIGGVNEKIEGFFDVCRMAGLNGEQGVLIPMSNVKHLMLRHDVVEAVAAGKFHVYPVETVDQGIEILTGVTAGEPGKSGRYPKGSVNRLVWDRLAAMAEKKRRHVALPDNESEA